ncbi:hypothetical protein OHW85_23815 [Acinetobacter baumannii]|nr:hypothetical protein [Acinetobacter baumannii]
MNTKQLKAFLEDNPDKTAQKLLKQLDPKLIKKFDKAIQALQDVILDIQDTYPDANYYVQEDSVLLMLGNSHEYKTSGDVTSNRNLEAHNDKNKLVGLIDGGAW